MDFVHGLGMGGLCCRGCNKCSPPGAVAVTTSSFITAGVLLVLGAGADVSHQAAGARNTELNGCWKTKSEGFGKVVTGEMVYGKDVRTQRGGKRLERLSLVVGVIAITTAASGKAGNWLPMLR